MAIGVGMQAAESSANLGIQTATQLTDAILKILEALSRRQSKIYRDADMDKGLAIVMGHAKEGGNVETCAVDTDIAGVFSECMKEFKVPFVALESEGKAVYVTRDIDTPSVRMAKERFQILVQKGLNEIPAERFMELANGQDMKWLKGLAPEEKEVFTAKMVGRSGTYAFLEENGKFDLLFLKKDEDSIMKAMKDMAFDFSGQNGNLYRQQIKEDLQERDWFLRDAIPNDGIMYVVDGDRPNVFLAVTKDSFTVHTIQEQNGKHRDITNGKKEDLDKLLSFAEGLKSPIVVSEEEMQLVVGIGDDGKALLAPQGQMKQLYLNMKNQLKDRCYYQGIRPKAKEKQEKILTLNRLSPDQIGAVYTRVRDAGLKGDVVVSSESIAFPERFSTEMKEILDETVYAGLRPLEKMEARLGYEGRGKLTLHNLTEPMFLLDAKRPDYAFCFTKEGVQIFEKGKATAEAEIDKLPDLFESMAEPVVLSRREMESTALRDQAIADRTEHETESSRYLNDQGESFKKDLYEVNSIGDPKYKTFNDRQQEALRLVYRHDIQDVFVERTLLEKVRDFDISRKRQEMHTTESEVSR